MNYLKAPALGIRILLALGMLLVMAVGSVDAPVGVSAHGVDASLIHLCVNDTNAESIVVHPLPIGGPAIDCVNPPWPLGAGWSPVDVGTISGVTAGIGLTGGGSIGPVILDADTAFLQQRVSSICAAGSSIRIINQDGTVSCEADSDTTFDGTDFALSNQACLVGQVVTGVDIDGKVTCETDAVGGGGSFGNYSLICGGCNLRSIQLPGADLNYAWLPAAEVQNANLAGATLTNANLSNAILEGADLTNADMTNAILIGADFSGANLTGAILSLSGVNLQGTRWNNVNLSGRNLSG